MRVLVTGATGFVGQEVVRRLVQDQHAVVALVRNPEAAASQALRQSLGIDLTAGDVLRPTTIAAALPGVQAVVHLVGIISEFGDSTFENIHVRGTANLVAAMQAAGVKRLIHMSALGTRPAAASRYHQTKWAAEELVRQRGLDFTIFRPSLIYGPGDHFINLFAKMIRWSPVVPILGRGRSRFAPVSVECVAKAFAGALAENGSVGTTFDLCGPEKLTLGELQRTIMAVLGWRRLQVRIPLPLARGQAILAEFVFKYLLRRPPPLNRDQLIMLEEDNIGDPRRANDLFSLRHPPLNEAFAKWLAPVHRSPAPANP